VAEVSGPLRALTNELRWLAEVADLTVAAPTGGAVTEELGDVATVEPLDFAPLMLPSGPAGALGALSRLRHDVREFRALIRRERSDLVLVASALLPAPLIAARGQGVATVVYAADPRTRADRAAWALISLSARAATAAIVPSRTMASQLPGSVQDKVTVMHPPISERMSGGDAEGFRRRHGIPPDEPCILAVGNLTPGRGQRVLLRALPRIRARVEGARLVLVGPTFDRPKDVAFETELRTLAREFGLTAAVTFAGYEVDMAGAYAASAIVVNPSLTHAESFGMAACEALVAGRPVVATRIGAVPEVLDGVPGTELVPPGDPDALASAVVRALEDPEASRHALAGGRAIAKRFPPERSLETFRRVVGPLVLISERDGR
jgi:glycosyltransferase involved in cell wall biosynthesis